MHGSGVHGTFWLLFERCHCLSWHLRLRPHIKATDMGGVHLESKAEGKRERRMERNRKKMSDDWAQEETPGTFLVMEKFVVSTWFPFCICRHDFCFCFCSLFFPVFSLKISLLKSDLLFRMAVIRQQGSPEMRSVCMRKRQGDSCHGVSTMLRRPRQLKTNPWYSSFRHSHPLLVNFFYVYETIWDKMGSKLSSSLQPTLMSQCTQSTVDLSRYLFNNRTSKATKLHG